MNTAAVAKVPGASGYNREELRTAVWQSDESFSLLLPKEWRLTTHWPRTPAALSDSTIARSLNAAVGQKPIKELCRGRLKPLVIVDDLNRPTPAYRVLPDVLSHFQQAGIPPQDVTILIATGTHAPPDKTVLVRKLGRIAASSCRVIVHDSRAHIRRIGKTTLGTQVDINNEILSSDFVMGIGGVYPNQTAGFGGGSKLVLGVLGFRSIMQLHYRHPGMGWGNGSCQHTFRRDLDEIARLAGLRTVVSLHIDAKCDVIRVTCGDPFLTYAAEAEFARRTFCVPPPDEADLIICNAYPADITLTSALMKGVTPLERAPGRASRILLASCASGVGHHGLFPIVDRPKHYRLQQMIRRVTHMTGSDLVDKIVRRVRHPRTRDISAPRNQIWLHRPLRDRGDLPRQIPGVCIGENWLSILDEVHREQGSSPNLRVVLYPCAPLQLLSGSAVS